ncbi:MAG: diaminopimelate decarboxylase [Chloroflexi bacterium]|nr:diaminopimelate decarboxylase [Chloroflexota bacterium]
MTTSGGIKIPTHTSVLPLGSSVNDQGHLVVGQCDVMDLLAEHGSPLYVYDEQTIRERCRQYVAGLGSVAPDSLVIYASKAFANAAIFQLLAEEGLGLDVVSGGEITLAHRSGFPMERVYFHGNNKLQDEMDLAVELGVGRFVVDNFHELGRLDSLGQRLGMRIPAMIRVGPGVEAHTHEYRKTGALDSKFGIPISTGQAETAVVQATRARGVHLIGLHAHIGSQVFEMAPYLETIDIVLDFAARMHEVYGLDLREFSPGGGWGISYTDEDDPMDADSVARAVGQAVWKSAAERGLANPRIVIEPGRSIVGQSGVALYTVGSIKDIPGVRRYAAVDGGMADNIRPALYGAVYQPVLANRMEDGGTAERVTIAGRYCESGDILVKDAQLPRLSSGDVVALPASGAYNLAMSSNYNMALRPAVVMVKDGTARVIRRRETYADLLGFESALD